MLLVLETLSFSKRKSRSRGEDLEWDWEVFRWNRSYSSIMFSTSSSVVTVIRASRSSLGSWYLTVRLVLLAILESLLRREEKEVVLRWTATTRVSPPT